MLVTKILRLMTVAGATLIAMSVVAHGVRAQEDAVADAKGKKTTIHASGSVAIAASPCASPTAGVECYSISSSSLKDNKVTGGTLTGTLLVSTTTSSPGKNKVCYTVLGGSTETVTEGTKVANLNFGPANACITTNTKKGTSIEKVAPPALWTIGTGSTETGKGKETWTVTPTNAAATTGALAGNGAVFFTGTASP